MFRLSDTVKGELLTLREKLTSPPLVDQVLDVILTLKRRLSQQLSLATVTILTMLT